jgi:hypothetical protein
VLAGYVWMMARGWLVGGIRGWDRSFGGGIICYLTLVDCTMEFHEGPFEYLEIHTIGVDNN